MYDWKTLLHELVQAKGGAASTVTAATPADILAAEKRLGVKLPPSYRAFLEYTNGCGALSSFIEELYPAARINWHRIISPDHLEVWREYGGAEAEDEIADLPHTLAVSTWSDVSIILLNPKVKTPDGEWQAWFWMDEDPHVFPSFWELMQAQLATQRQINNVYARRRNPDAPTPDLAVRLPQLIQQIEQHKHSSTSMFPPMMQDDAYRAAIDAIITRIQQMPTDDSVALRRNLRQLANELIAEGQAPTISVTNALFKLLFQPNKLADEGSSLIKRQVYLVIGGQIRAFLGEIG